MNPKDGITYYNRGNAYHQLGDHKQAIRDLDKSIELRPTDAKAFTVRGGAYTALRDYERAVGDYGKAIELDPKYYPAYGSRGVAFQEMGDYQRAIADFEKMIALQPDKAAGYYVLARFYVSAKDRKFRNGKLAIKYAKKAVELDREDPSRTAVLAAAYAEAGRFKDAIATQTEAIVILKRKNQIDAEDLKKYERDLNLYRRNKALP